MAALSAGDVVLDGVSSTTRVLISQHRTGARSIAPMLTVHHSGGHLSLTAEHALLVDGTFAPARLAVP
eukprot:2606117-Prymnesium_polylepis.1